MGQLYLVRHAQASFGAADYDQLSALGERQSLRLGEYFASKGLVFEAVITGSLRRHAQTFAGIAQGAGLNHTPLVLRGLNEYDSAALIASVHPQPLPKPETPEAYRHYFRVLRQGLTQWARGEVAPVGMPRYADFAHGVREALDHVRRQHSGNVLMVSSGGPIGSAVAQVLGAGADAAIDLNMRIRNTAVTEFSFNPKRHSLLGFNSVAHLDDARFADWVTYA
jgi:broad specificity phosphatase PhoE